MLIGFVSDEYYVALPDTLLEIDGPGLSGPLVVRSTSRGGIYADLTPGPYNITLSKPGYGSKRTTADVVPGRPQQFRLLSDALLGYMWPKWTSAGGRGEFRVHAVEQYHLSLWRYGLQKECIRPLGWYDEHGPRATMQILPDGDFTQTGVRWNEEGYGGSQQAQTLAAPDESGLYYLHAKTLSGRFFAFPWVVAPRAPKASVAVLVSTNTWNAYNAFGGRSNYLNPAGLPEQPIVNARQDLDRYRSQEPFGLWRPRDDAYLPLSFDRPDPSCHVPETAQVSDPIAGRLPPVAAPAEWRLLAWLEREGFAYDLYAEAQLDAGSLPLEAYQVLILAVHPEYWTRRMYQRVKAWVYEGGGRLLYLGGNGLNCEVELDGSAGTMRCLTHLYSRAGEMGGDIDQPDRSFESRLHRTYESEANLLGVVCTETGIMTAAPYEVRAASHWAFEGTMLRDGDRFGATTLHERVPGGASGHETDKRSASSPPGTELLAKGLNPDEGGAEIVCYGTASAGAVFSVGSITYVSALLVDDGVSRITKNVLHHFLST
ncbi:MAG: carboxypeptidase regulatory-like domain-containing protein [Luteitalea sp.]|nr:carboxypeptidase regulatory-like domain-containing protein [Luteitalea sp.]